MAGGFFIIKLKTDPLVQVTGIRCCQLFVVFIRFLWCQRKRASCGLRHTTTERHPYHSPFHCWSFGRLEFMPGTGTPQSCRDFKNSLCSDSLKSFFGIFSGAQQMPMGEDYKHGPSRSNQVSEPVRLRSRALWTRLFTS